jgi:hypothetical protein
MFSVRPEYISLILCYSVLWNAVTRHQHASCFCRQYLSVTVAVSNCSAWWRTSDQEPRCVRIATAGIKGDSERLLKHRQCEKQSYWGICETVCSGSRNLLAFNKLPWYFSKWSSFVTMRPGCQKRVNVGTRPHVPGQEQLHKLRLRCTTFLTSEPDRGEWLASEHRFPSEEIVAVPGG